MDRLIRAIGKVLVEEMGGFKPSLDSDIKFPVFLGKHSIDE
ncbi:hypothetical protein LEP1GSC017_1382 [Leptospira meyeri serovar Hardjo str. Went 5]|nr:hypothetical protein LEP1GSC017_1382 [Leptospira meyeri serovar Hardjo str. Went 5]EMJ87901.1 hypothetical protein LEP1GSC196_2028 [Leptospira meyeri serovar Semaranga str. Veldrot Semarang 173]